MKKYVPNFLLWRVVKLFMCVVLINKDYLSVFIIINVDYFRIIIHLFSVSYIKNLIDIAVDRSKELMM